MMAIRRAFPPFRAPNAKVCPSKRLQAMPREQRVHLADNLDRFDALSDEERESIRRFDAQIAALDPALQSRYRALLRRYHVWVSGLDDAKREELATVDSLQDKLALVTKWLKAEKQAIAASKSNFMLGIQPGDLGTFPPFEMANALRVWFKLTPTERGPIEAIPAIPRRLDALRRV